MGKILKIRNANFSFDFFEFITFTPVGPTQPSAREIRFVPEKNIQGKIEIMLGFWYLK